MVWTAHFGVIISWLVGERARESRLQTSIGGGGADGFSNTMSGRNIFRTRGVRGARSGARRRPVLLYTKGVKVKAAMKYCVERDRVGATAIIRRVDNEGDVIRQHFVDIKDNTSISLTTERVPPNNRKRIRVGDGRTLTAGEVEPDDHRGG